MSRRDAVRALGTAVVGTAIGSSFTPSQLATYNVVTPPVPDLTGKTLVVKTLSRPLAIPLILGGCSFETQAGRLFLSGTNVPCAPGSYNWTDGVRQLVAWDAVEEYMVFESVEDYHARLIIPMQASNSAALGTAEELATDSDFEKACFIFLRPRICFSEVRTLRDVFALIHGVALERYPPHGSGFLAGFNEFVNQRFNTPPMDHVTLLLTAFGDLPLVEGCDAVLGLLREWNASNEAKQQPK
jgi:hypothetical protein